MLRFACMPIALLCITCLSAQSPPPDVLIRLQTQVSESLYALPDYVCRLDIRRTEVEPQARGRTGRSRPAETLSLDVAMVDHKEHYALPGAANFSDLPPSQLVAGGMISSGSFAAFARDILVNHVGTVHYVGPEKLDDEAALRYDYDVALRRSGYNVANDGQSAIAPYRGSFWASVDGADLLRITVEADELPLYLGVKRVTTEIDYQAAVFDERTFIVPKRTRVRMMLSDGGESLNETKFTACRAFISSSTLSF